MHPGEAGTPCEPHRRGRTEDGAKVEFPVAGRTCRAAGWARGRSSVGRRAGGAGAARAEVSPGNAVILKFRDIDETHS